MYLLLHYYYLYTVQLSRNITSSCLPDHPKDVFSVFTLLYPYISNTSLFRPY